MSQWLFSQLFLFWCSLVPQWLPLYVGRHYFPLFLLTGVLRSAVSLFFACAPFGKRLLLESLRPVHAAIWSLKKFVPPGVILVRLSLKPALRPPFRPSFSRSNPLFHAFFRFLLGLFPFFGPTPPPPSSKSQKLLQFPFGSSGSVSRFISVPPVTPFFLSATPLEMVFMQDFFLLIGCLILVSFSFGPFPFSL